MCAIGAPDSHPARHGAPWRHATPRQRRPDASSSATFPTSATLFARRRGSWLLVPPLKRKEGHDLEAGEGGENIFLAQVVAEKAPKSFREKSVFVSKKVKKIGCVYGLQF